MKQPRNKAAILALLAGGVALWPAFGQDRPESILPPGFGEEQPVAPVRVPSDQPAPAAPTDLLPSTSLALPADSALAESDEPEGNEAGDEADNSADPYDLPPSARRSIEVAGPLEPGFGLGPDAYGSASGALLAGLMRRLDAPIASRWASILLRRALLSRVATPRGIDPVDWIAERAWLLLRMGEADGARMLVQAVDVDRFDSRMYAIAAQVALATADPAALCPLTANALGFSNEPIWPMANAMCAALSGETSLSGAMAEQLRARRVARGIDLLLAEKVVGAGGGGRRAVTIQWDGVDRLNAWRFGLATATGVDIPAQLFATVGPQVQAWRARAAMVPLEQRIGAARTAAALGVFSNAVLVDLYGAFADQADTAEVADTDAARLRQAYAGEDIAARMQALRGIWGAAQGPRDRYAAAILTARAAARITPSADLEQDSPALIDAMMSAGLDSYAARWGTIVDAMDPAAGDRAWSMLAVGAPRPAVNLAASRVRAFVERNRGQRAQMLVAALAGLGRLAQRDAQQLAEDSGLAIAHQDGWTRAIDAASRSGQKGTVAVLVAEAMQTPLWQHVPPRHFLHMIAALDRVGLDAEARMIAAEAMSRV